MGFLRRMKAYFFLLIFCVSLNTKGNALDHWQWRNPLPHGYDFQDLAYGNGTFVALTVDNQFGTSTNGSDWNLRRFNDGPSLISVTFGDGKFVASGVNGVLTVSDDGIVWHTGFPLAPDKTYLYKTVYAHGLFVAVGQNGIIISSPDGTNWTAHPSPHTFALEHVFYGGGYFVATGIGIPALTSPDGINWTLQTVPGLNTNNFVGFAGTFGNGTFVVGSSTGGIIASTNGTNWTLETSISPKGVSGLAYDGSNFLAAGSGGTLLSSSNGINWNPLISTSLNNLHGIACGNGVRIAVGEFGTILKSFDSTTWGKVESTITDAGISGFTCGNGEFVGVTGSGSVVSSGDGTNWNIQSISTNSLSAVDFDRNIFVAVGAGGTIMRSTNGASWNTVSSPTSVSLYSITHGNGLFMASGPGGISPLSKLITSPDGITWTVQNPGATNFSYNPLLFGNGLFVCFGSYILSLAGDLTNVVRTSPDGINWTNQPFIGFTNYNNSFMASAYGNGRFVLETLSGVAFISTNGLNWRPYTNGLFFATLGFGNGLFLGVSGGRLYSSVDGINWAAHGSIDDRGINCLAYGLDSFVAGGSGGTILQSDKTFVPNLTINYLTNQTAILAEGEMGREYWLQTSTNFNIWTNVMSYSNSAETVLIVDSNATGNVQFYRSLLKNP